jgi:hypothetical protein
MLCGALSATLLAQQRNLDIVVANGRVMDPESGLNAIRHVGVRGDRIVALSADPLDSRLRVGGTRLNAAGLVVAPGSSIYTLTDRAPDANHFRTRSSQTCAEFSRLDFAKGPSASACRSSTTPAPTGARFFASFNSPRSATCLSSRTSVQ